jgi:hypothetical protein
VKCITLRACNEGNMVWIMFKGRCIFLKRLVLLPNTRKIHHRFMSVLVFIKGLVVSMSPKDIPKDAKYTVVVHEGSVIHALHLMAKHKKFDNVREIVVCCTHFIPLDGITHNHEQRNKDAMRHLEKYKKDLKGVKIIVLTMTDLSPVMDAIFKRGLQKTKPRTGLVYVMWLVLQNHIVYLNGFDIENTDLLTHAFEPKVTVPKNMMPKLRVLSLNNLFLKSWW